MKNKITTLLAASFMTAAYGQSPAPININGGFETATVGANSAESWYFAAAGGAVVEYQIIATDAIEGVNALSANVTALGSESWNVQVVNATIAAEAYTVYKCTAQIKAASDGLKASIYGGLAGDPYTTMGNTNQFTVPTDWKKYVFTLYSGEYTELRVVYELNNIGTYYIDDVQFIPTPIKEIYSNKRGDTLFIEPCFPIKVYDSTAVLDFEVKRNGIKDSLVSSMRVAYNKFAVVMQKIIAPKDEITLSYGGSKIIYSSNAPADIKGTAFESFYDEPVTNNAIKGYNKINERNLTKLEIYPNPAVEKLILMNCKEVNSVEIYNISGTRLRSITLNSGNIVNVAGMKSGMYFLKANKYNGTSDCIKFIKK